MTINIKRIDLKLKLTKDQIKSFKEFVNKKHISVKTLLHDQIKKFIENSKYFEMSFL